MESLFEPAAAESILSRLQMLEPTTRARWGKMNVAQMLAHCSLPLEQYFRENKVRRSLTGFLFGRMAKKRLFSNKPWPRNLPTAKQFRIKDQKEFVQEKKRLAAIIQRFSTEGFTITQNIHPFFGKMSSQEWALFCYRHLDHHLQQFGV